MKANRLPALAATVLAAAGLITGGPTASPATASQARVLPAMAGVGSAATNGQDCSTASSPTTGLVKDAHPVILVHGWTGGPMQKTRAQLEKTMKTGWQFLLFDYRDAATRWADAPQIAGCLADYISAVSNAHKRAGGDGRVYLVAHSMGGLAVRFASAKPGVGNRVAGMVTLDTPHAGSPWGNASSGPWARLHELTAGYWKDVPADGTKARTCLAVHQGPTGMPPGCAVAPYLPGTTPIATIGGNLTIRRTVFGFLSYDVPTGGDTIVTQDSSQSYFDSAPSGRVRQGTHVYPISVPCTQDFNGIVNAAASLSTPLVGPLVGGFLQLQSDNKALDDILRGSASTAMLDVLIAANLVPSNCSHSGIVTNPQAISETVKSLKTMAAADATSGGPTIAQLASAIVPAACGHTTGPAHNYVRSTGPGEVDIITRKTGNLDVSPVRGDITRDSAPDIAAALWCTAGGVSWPQTVALWGPGPRLLGSVDLGDYFHHEHADVTSMTISGSDVLTAGSTYEGCCFDQQNWTGRLHWDGKALQLLDIKLGPVTNPR